MRTFIAIDLSQDAVKEIIGLQSELKRSDADVKWVEPDNMHLTLKFLGEVSDQQLAQVKETLDKVAKQFKPYEIILSGIGAFPKIDYPRVVWAGIEDEKSETKGIADKIDVELEKLGFPKEEREFSAHLTLGRVRSAKNRDKLKSLIQATKFSSEIKNTITCITVYQSTITSQGPIYTVLHKAAI